MNSTGSSKLAERLRGIIGAPDPKESGRREPSLTPSSLQEVLGGEWRPSGDGRSFVVERRIPADVRHGRVLVGELAEKHDRAAVFLPILFGGVAARPPYLFFDLETTGLSGGAGTVAFLIGGGWFDQDGAFLMRQHVLTQFGDEPSMLGAVAADLAHAGALVSFNGKSFDAPVLETRYLYHRREWRSATLAHIDVLHPSRLFWGHDTRGIGAAAFRQGRECSLAALETHVLGVHRVRDVPGFEIPTRYFQFVRSGDARPLAAVLEHNRHDLLSLAGLSARLLELVAGGPGQAHDAGEALALGRVYARGGLDARAIDAFEHALAMCAATTGGAAAQLRVTALRALAYAARRGRRFEDAAVRWRQVLDTPGCPAHVKREASEALAIHHEHRAGDLVAAKTFALRSLDCEARAVWNEAVHHRLARIQRKIERSGTPGLLAY